MDNTIVISTPPHVKAKQTTRSIMRDVVIAMLPCAIAGIVYFGWRALIIELVCVLSCILTEFVYFFIANKGFAKKCKNAKETCIRFLKQFDLTSVVTGLILALILPSTVKWYECVIGSIFAIAIVKMLFGGTGKNLVNPAAMGRAVMFLSFSITTYTACLIEPIMLESEIFTGATNLSGHILQGEASGIHLLDLFLGTGLAGCIGETCKLAILAGYVYLAVRKIIKWWQPLLFIAVFGLTAVLCDGFNGENYVFDITRFLPNVLSGGVLFATVFMVPDYVTSPKGMYGQIFYLVAGAILFAVLRYLTKIEIASFAILIMNLFVPLIDRYMIRKPFGYKKPKKEGA